MRRLFWMLVGAGIASWAITRARSLRQALTPQGVAAQVERRGTEVASGLGEFYATFKTAMTAREAELRAELNLPERST